MSLYSAFKYNPNSGRMYSKAEQLGRNILGETQHGTPGWNPLNKANWEGTTENIRKHVTDAYNGLRQGRSEVSSASGLGKIRATGRLLGIVGEVAKPVAALATIGGGVSDSLGTSTEDYQKRFGIGKDDMLAKSDSPLWQAAKDGLVRSGGLATDILANVADSTPFVPDIRKYFADKQPAPAPAPAPEDGLRQTQPAPLPKLQVGAPFKTDGISPEMQARMREKGIKFEGAATPPSPVPEYGNSTEPLKKGNLSVIQTGGVDNYMRQLNTIRGLREPETPVANRIHVVGQTDFLGRPLQDPVTQKAMEAIDGLPRGMSPGNKADAVAGLLSVATGAQRANAEAARPARGATGESAGPSFRDLLEAKKFQHQVGRDSLQDALAVENNTRQNQIAGSTLASTGANVANTNAKMEADEFSQLFRKRDTDNKDVADTETISRFKGQLGQALATLANTNDPKDRRRYAMQYQGVDGPKWRAKQWDELDDATKNHLTQMFRYAERMQALNNGGIGGGNFGMYNNPARDKQGRLVVRDGDKVRAIVDANKLNSDDSSLFPFFGQVPEKFGNERPRDIGGQFGAGR